MDVITVTYTSIDGAHAAFQSNDIESAREFAQHWIGQYPCLGRSYAVSDDGIGKITVFGATLRDLFPEGC